MTARDLNCANRPEFVAWAQDVSQACWTVAGKNFKPVFELLDFGIGKDFESWSNAHGHSRGPDGLREDTSRESSQPPCTYFHLSPFVRFSISTMFCASVGHSAKSFQKSKSCTSFPTKAIRHIARRGP